MDVSEHILKLSGSVELNEETAKTLVYQKDFTITCTGSLVMTQDCDLQDGSFRKKYTIKVSSLDIIQ